MTGCVFLHLAVPSLCLLHFQPQGQPVKAVRVSGRLLLIHPHAGVGQAAEEELSSMWCSHALHTNDLPMLGTTDCACPATAAPASGDGTSSGRKSVSRTSWNHSERP